MRRAEPWGAVSMWLPVYLADNPHPCWLQFPIIYVRVRIASFVLGGWTVLGGRNDNFNVLCKDGREKGMKACIRGLVWV